jgi:ATP-dependent DNA helicase RecQ
VLKGERRIRLRLDPDERPGRERRRERGAIATGGDADQTLFQALRARRLALAQAQGVPPYVIFHDSTLVEMARAKPRTAEEFARLPGVGEAKLARYAGDFLQVIISKS